MGQSTSKDSHSSSIALPYLPMRNALASRLKTTTRGSKIPKWFVDASCKDPKKHHDVYYTVYGDTKNFLPILRPEILPRVLPFLIDRLPHLMALSPCWYITLHDFILRNWCADILNGFIKAYSPYFSFVTAALSTQPLYTSTFGLRIDLLIHAKVEPKAANHCVEIKYGANTFNGQPCNARYRVEVKRKGATRSVWVRKDIPTFHGAEVQSCSTASTPTACVNDYIEIPVNLSNANDVINPLTVTWCAPVIIADAADRELGQKCLLDVDCMWFDRDAFQQRQMEAVPDLDMFRPTMVLRNAWYTGCSIVIAKGLYQILKTGPVVGSAERLGTRFTVVPKGGQIVVPLQRLGLEHDRFADRVLRMGDSFLMYFVIGGPEIP